MLLQQIRGKVLLSPGLSVSLRVVETGQVRNIFLHVWTSLNKERSGGMRDQPEAFQQRLVSSLQPVQTSTEAENIPHLLNSSCTSG